MKNGIDCERFRDRFDELMDGELGPEARRELERHAEGCPDCSILLRVNEHLDTASREELEAAVPDHLVSTMLPRLRRELARRGAGPRPTGRSPRAASYRSRWIPTLAAAAVLLLAANLYLLRETVQLRERESRLTERIERTERRLAELDASIAGDARARTAALGETRSWQRMLARTDRVSVAELISLLDGLAAGTTLLGPEEIRRPPEADLPWAGAIWTSRFRQLDLSDGLQAGELLDAIEGLPIDPGRSIPTGRILEGIERLSVQG